MTEAWHDTAAQQTLAVQDATGLVERIQDVISGNVLELAGLVLLGAVIGIACTSIVKKIWPPLDEAPREVCDARYRLYTLSGIGFGGFWTLVVSTSYLSATMAPGLFVALTVAAGLATAAAAATPYVYDILNWIWTKLIPALGQAALGWIRKKFGK